ncbi:MAG TPA: hypothetical protein DIT31_02850 [Methylophaga sp.]|nr:hypothetical protein [Methylophaga sp.]
MADQYEKYQDRDYSNDQIPPKFIHEQLRAHDKKMRDKRNQWALTKACYTTNYWKHIRHRNYTGKQHQTRDNEINVEVNRLFGIITAYLSALYPRAQRAIVMPDPNGIGDSMKSELALNRFMESSRIHHRIMTALRQALLYPGCGAKVGYYAGRGNPLDRVWMRVIPWWEMVLDSDVGDAEDERFRGHVYYRPKKEVEEEYGLKDLSGTERDDFLRVGYTGKDASSAAKRAYPKQDKARSDNSNFVRVLEVCNLKDTYEDKENPGIFYEGRLEIYVLGQGKKSNKPVYVGPLPFAEVDGRPLAHIVPLIFNHEPEYPLRGMAHADRLLPQIQELNSYRSFMAMATRKDTRQFVTRKGTFGADEMTDLTEGHDGLILQLEQDYDRPLGDAIMALGNTPISSNIDQYMAYVENDLDRNVNLSPSARGIVTKATAFEVQAVQQYTESEFGMHASIKDEWLTSILKVVLRALISSMQDLGDSAGAFEDQDVQLAEVGAVSEEQPQEQGEDQEQGEASGQEQLDAAQEQEEDAEQQPFVSEDSVEGYKQDKEEEGKVESDVLVLRDRREFVDISVEDLNADFSITFVEGGGAPMEEATQQQNLLGLLEPYTALWAASQEGGPQGFMARAYMKTMAEKFNLPKDLHPDELDAKYAEEAEQEEAPEAGTDEQVLQEGAQQQEPQAAPDLSDLAQLPPDQAITAMRDIFAEDPEMQQVLDQLETLPPEQQSQMIAQILSTGEESAPV